LPNILATSMKYIFITIGTVLLISIIIIAFGNIGAMCTDLTFFFNTLSPSFSVTIGIFIISFLGIMAGAALMAGVMFHLKDTGEDEDDDY
jgi:hypothetical protein